MSEKLTEREKWIIEQCSISWAPKGCSIDEAYFIDNAPACTRIAELEAEVGRLREVVTDWIADVAQRDGGKVFQNRVSGLASAPITYADMRNLMAALSPQVGEKKGCKHCNDGVTRIGGNCEDCGGTGEA